MGRGQGDPDAIREAAALGAVGDLAEAFVGGDQEGVEASFHQLKQLSQGLDLAAIRERIDVPEDAGEWAGGLIAIMERIPDGWGRWIRCGKGWYGLLVELDQAIAALDPRYEVHQAKEKYGTLRYYMQPSSGTSAEIRERIDKLVAAAEKRSAETCEGCGQTGQLHMTQAPSPWYQTLCTECASGQRQGRAPWLTQPEWEAWWAIEQPRHQAAARTRFLHSMKGKRVLAVGAGEKLDRLSFEATIVRNPDEARRLVLTEEWDELWLDEGPASDAAVEALADRYREHAIAQRAASAAHFAKAHAEGRMGGGFILNPPSGAPRLTRIGKVSFEPISEGYAFRSSYAQASHYLNDEE